MSLLPGCGTVSGRQHEARGVACEDASGIWRSRERDGVFVLAVADGHGDNTCVRSAMGARLAVDISIERLREVAELSDERLSALTYDSPEVRELGPIIVEEWKRLVLSDLAEHPLSDAELDGLDAELMARWMSEHPTHAYGTTLVAAVVTPNICIFIQQGDGCCAVLDASGGVFNPVPDDELCVGNTTTSLSDDDSSERVRMGMARSVERGFIGCFVASDGVEKSCLNDDDLEMFFRSLTMELQKKEGHALDDALRGILREVSDMGSHDDASIACVVETRLSRQELDVLRSLVERQRLHSELTEIRDKLVSMERKHAMLTELWLSGKQDEASEYESYHATWERLLERESELAGQLSGLDIDAFSDDDVTEIDETQLVDVVPAAEATAPASPHGKGCAVSMAILACVFLVVSYGVRLLLGTLALT